MAAPGAAPLPPPAARRPRPRAPAAANARTRRGAFASARDGANKGSDSSAATNHGCIALLVILSDSHISLRLNRNILSFVKNRRESKTQGRAAFHTPRLLNVNNPSRNRRTLLQYGLS